MAYILVIDDEQPICWLIKEALEGIGYLIKTATDWRQGLTMVQEEPPVIVLLDFKLPGISGASLFEKIKRAAPQSAVVLMTGDIDATKGLPAAARLAKPFDLNDLRNLVQNLVSVFPEGP